MHGVFLSLLSIPFTQLLNGISLHIYNKVQGHHQHMKRLVTVCHEIMLEKEKKKEKKRATTVNSAPCSSSWTT